MRIRELFGAVALGLLLLVIGSGTGTRGVLLAGSFILPLAFLWGALFETDNSMPVKITLMAIGGILLAVTTKALLAPSLELPW